MDAFGDQVQVETSVPPYGCTHMLFTDLKPQRGGYKFAHASTVIDIYTPLDKDRTPALVDAWRYMMSAESSCKWNRCERNPSHYCLVATYSMFGGAS